VAKIEKFFQYKIAKKAGKLILDEKRQEREQE
jgi:hypothetical protein